MAHNPSWQGDGYIELNLRAHAQQLGITDPAAKFLLEQLGFGAYSDKRNSRAEMRALRRSGWFDRRCEAFFSRHPEALCIELGAGFSTRFHRLSARADWPRFHWLEVDTYEVIQQKNGLLPRIDNYELVASEITSPDWLQFWEGEPLMVIAEHQFMKLSAIQVHTLFSNIAIRSRQLFEMGRQNISVEIAFDCLKSTCLPWRTRLPFAHKFPTTFLSVVDSDYSVLSEVHLEMPSGAQTHWLERCYHWINGWGHREVCIAVALNHIFIK